MWLIILTHCVLWLHVIMSVHGHLPAHINKEMNKIDAACDQAKKCIHDTIPICGRSATGDEKKRAFWDVCDLFEYVCDNEEVWRHIPDEQGCPPEEKKKG